MKAFSALLVFSLAVVALAGPAFKSNDNQINSQQHLQLQQQQQQQYHSGNDNVKSQAIDILKQWCFSSQMSQQELTASFKKLVGVVKSSAPRDQTTESAVMNERICQGALVQKSGQTGQTVAQTGADAQAHELIKDVYMDALISCKSRECTEQLAKIIDSNQVDSIRASYYMTRLAVTETSELKDSNQIKQLAESFISNQQTATTSTKSESIERQKLFAITSLIGKWMQTQPEDQQMKQTAQQVVKTIVERYIKPVSQQEVQEYVNCGSSCSKQTSDELISKIAKRSAALKALANIPGHVLKQCGQDVIETIVSLAQNKQELVTVRQSAIECLEQNDSTMEIVKKIAFDHESEPIEVRIAAYRALMTCAYAANAKDESKKQQVANQIVDQVVKHCEQERNQQQDDQFVLYVISHLDNIRTSQQPEHKSIKECIVKNKQHNMQIQVLCKKLKQQLNDIRHSSRNYKLEQEFNQIESGLIIEGDLIYESQSERDQQQLPKVVRANVSVPVMGKTVPVIEVTLRQDKMDEELLSALQLVQSSKGSFGSNTVSKVVDSFRQSAEKKNQKQQYNSNSNTNTNDQDKTTEADLTIKVDGCTIVYLCLDDFKSTSTATTDGHKRSTRSIYSSSLVDDVIEYLKRKPVAFNRGFNVNFNERLAKVLDVDANVIAGLRFESRASGSSSDNYEIVAQIEPRFAFEAIVGPSKPVNSKKLLQRFSTKTALGMRLRYKKNELVDAQIDLPMNTMDLFTVETQLVEKKSPSSYSYLPESIYGQEDIYSTPMYNQQQLDTDSEDSRDTYMAAAARPFVKRSIFESSKKSSSLSKLLSGKSTIAQSLEISEELARAIGLRGQLRFVAKPNDLSMLVSAKLEKYEPTMRGYRVVVQKDERSSSYVLTLSTPNSRIERTMQVRFAKQANSQRTLVKSEVQIGQLDQAMSFVCELVHDGRQYSAKVETVGRSLSGKQQQWRHAIDCGLLRSSQSPNGRFAATTYKPYVTINSSALRRPIQLQGAISYQQSPKTVISYELRCPTASSGSFVQGKLIIDSRSSSSSAAAYSIRRRSMQSPVAVIMKDDFTLTNEVVAQIAEHAFKTHSMVDWSASKWAMQGDLTATYKNLRYPSAERQHTVQMKFNPDEQMITVLRKCPQQAHKDFRFQVSSLVKSSQTSSSGFVHQFQISCQTSGRRSQPRNIVYKHTIDAQQFGANNKYDCAIQVELVDSERQINEKLQGRARVSNERRMKQIQCDLSSRGKVAKVNVDFVSLAEHQIQCVFQSPSKFDHKTEVVANKRQFVLKSRTDKYNQLVSKIVVDFDKVNHETKFVVECPSKRVNLAANLVSAAGKQSSFAVQTPAFACRSEFVFEPSSIRGSYKPAILKSIVPSFILRNNMRVKGDLKDLINKEAYWMDSAISSDEPSYMRIDSPVYRTDVEFNPRDMSTKLGAFARSKRSIDDSIYSSKESSLVDFVESQLMNSNNKLNLGKNKLWMLRALVAPSSMNELQKQARRALFEYADRRQAHKHSVNWSPMEEKVNFDFSHAPYTYDSSSVASWEPTHMRGDLSTSWSRPSSMSLKSSLFDFDLDTKPFDGEESYAKLSALTRHRRSSPSKKHEGEWRYKKDTGYTGQLSWADKNDRRHLLSMMADESPKKWTKMSYENEKHGKAHYEHQWRKHVNKRSNSKHGNEEEQVYSNWMEMRAERPDGKLVHKTKLDWDEPLRMVESRRNSRYTRSIRSSWMSEDASDASIYRRFSDQLSRYSPVEYLKHTSARLESSSSPLYKVDFDYQPHMNAARFDFELPKEDLLHSSSFVMKPEQSYYKLASKLFNKRTQEPTYDFLVSRGHFDQSPAQMATADEEPVFVSMSHDSLERPIRSSAYSTSLLKAPMKLAYSDKYGRVASFDYDLAPRVSGVVDKYAGLRQKRAAVYYKDNRADLEHSTSFDFYPEQVLGSFKKQYQSDNRVPSFINGDVLLKTSTKYGPVVLRAETGDNTGSVMQFDLETPVGSAKVYAPREIFAPVASSYYYGERAASRDAKLVKVVIENKSQRVNLEKIVRKTPIVRECDLAKKFARKFDSSRFEHETELLYTVIDTIIKIKSETRFVESPRDNIVIDAEINKPLKKVIAKINGERVKGQLSMDLADKTCKLVMEKDGERVLEHMARAVRVSDKFYHIDAVTSYKSKPLMKLNAKVSAWMIEEPEHIFASHSARNFGAAHEHVSTFEAVVYEPKELFVSGVIDCMNKEAKIVFKNVEEQKIQETRVVYDEREDAIKMSAVLSSPEGQEYVSKAKVSVAGLLEQLPILANSSKLGHAASYKCQHSSQSCASELVYSNKQGESYAAKYVPNEYASIMTPSGKQYINLAY